MYSRRVLLINVRSLLIEGVESLLRSQGNQKFEVISTLASGIPDLMREIDLLKPNVIVVDEITSFINPAELIASLLDTGYIRLIVLNSQTSKIDIYDKNESMIHGPDHLMEAINNGSVPS
jgi:DNA-binding NarL/FixJ family response regulator